MSDDALGEEVILLYTTSIFDLVATMIVSTNLKEKEAAHPGMKLHR